MTIGESEVQTLNAFRLVLKKLLPSRCFSKLYHNSMSLRRSAWYKNFLFFSVTRLRKLDGDKSSGWFPKQLKSLTGMSCKLVYGSSGSWPSLIEKLKTL